MANWYYLFPGQGAQRVGMGGGFLEDPEVQEAFRVAEKILRYPLYDLVLNGPEETLNLTEWAQPALFVLGYAVAQKLERLGYGVEGALGHSLGELTALGFAGVFPFEVGVELTHLRGKAMQEGASPEESLMVAAIGLDLKGMERALAGVKGVYIANWNHPDQVVLSGKKHHLEPFLPELKRKGVRRLVPLRVSAPFHSPYMEGARQKLAAYLSTIPLAPPRFPVYSNVTAAPYPSEPAQIRELLAQQVVSPVLWVEEVRNLKEPWQGLELPPAGVLAGLCKRIVPEIRVQELRSPQDLPPP